MSTTMILCTNKACNNSHDCMYHNTPIYTAHLKELQSKNPDIILQNINPESVTCPHNNKKVKK